MVHLIENIAPVLLILEKIILALLLLLEAGILAVFTWRLRSYALARGDASKWTKLLTSSLAGEGMKAIAVGEADLKTVPGRLVKTGLDNITLVPEAMEKVFDAQESMERRNLEQGLSFLGTVGANAAFVGLTGTVIGILVAFDRFAASGGRGSTEVMVAISQALVATFVGLAVAIPAVVFYNILRNKSNAIIEQSREIRSLILAHSFQTTFTRQEG